MFLVVIILLRFSATPILVMGSIAVRVMGLPLITSNQILWSKNLQTLCVNLPADYGVDRDTDFRKSLAIYFNITWALVNLMCQVTSSLR